MKIGIRADGGEKRGIGHLVRSGVLADQFLQEGYDVTYITQTPEAVKEVCPSGVGIHTLSSRNPLQGTIDWIEQTGAKVVVSDCYDVDTRSQQAIFEVTDCFVVVQVDDRHDLCCDILVNSHLFGAEIEYQWLHSEPKWCTGTDYLLLRKGFQELVENQLDYRSPPERALITMGGSDVTNTTPTAMRAFDGHNISVEVIIGLGYTNEKEIGRVASDTDCKFNLVESPTDLPSRMAQADIAVSAFGTTSYELLATKTPFIGIPVVENQKRTARAFQRRDLAVVTTQPDKIEEGVDRLIQDTEYRQKLATKYNSVIDGRGAERLIEEIYSVVRSTHENKTST